VSTAGTRSGASAEATRKSKRSPTASEHRRNEERSERGGGQMVNSVAMTGVYACDEDEV
jgi:hypothetical protein